MENWKDVKDYERRYQVSSEGRVKSLERTISNGKGFRIVKERILKQIPTGNGYLQVSLKKDGKLKTHKVHKLIAISFLGHIPCGFKIVCDHINNIRTDNRVENLQLLTNRENSSKDQKGTSKYTGIYWNKHAKKWHAQIKINGKSKHLGLFTDELEAAAAYQHELSSNSFIL